MKVLRYGLCRRKELDLVSRVRNERKRLRRLVLFAAPRSRNGPAHLSL